MTHPTTDPSRPPAARDDNWAARDHNVRDDNAALTDPTLGNLLRESVRARLPERFYWLLQTCVPWAMQFWAWGWLRTAGWLGVASLYGLWAIAEKRIERGSEPRPSWDSSPPIRVGLWRAVRAVAGFAGVAAAAALLVDLFLQLLTVGFNCARCAG
jgi:hypothetical protein